MSSPSFTEKLLDLETNQKIQEDLLFQLDAENKSEDGSAIMPGSEQVHRSVAALLVSGKSPDQIAETLNIALDKVSRIIKQKHTQECIKEFVKEQGTEAVANILKATEVDNILRIIQIRDDVGTPPAVALNACKVIAEMQRGKKPYANPDEDDQVHGEQLAGKVGIIDEQIKELQKRTKIS